MGSLTQIKVHAFTLKHETLANVLHTPLRITLPDEPNNYYDTRGIWDTGASATVITQTVVDKLNLKPIGKIYTNTASESNVLADQFLLDIFLKEDLRIKEVKATMGKIVQGIDCLIGMDIISLGDFSITNFQRKTIMSFRVPSMLDIDYVKRIPQGIYPPEPRINRNDPCPCGSGKNIRNVTEQDKFGRDVLDRNELHFC